MGGVGGEGEYFCVIVQSIIQEFSGMFGGVLQIQTGKGHQ